MMSFKIPRSSMGSVIWSVLVLGIFFILLTITGRVEAQLAGGDVYISCGTTETSCDLGAIIANNQGNLTVILANNVTLQSTIKVVGRRITLWGALNVPFRPYIAGGSSIRLFYVDSFAQLRLRNLTVQDGFANDPKGGGVIALRPNASLVAEGVYFVNNQASAGDGGAILSEEAGVFLHQCSFESNRASMGDGGAIAALKGYIQVTETIFSDNTAFFSGGAIRTSRSSFVVSSTYFLANTARNGGACSFSEATMGVVDMSTFERNDAAYGGAILDANNMLSIVSSAFNSNMAWDATSQGIYVMHDVSSMNGSLFLTNLTLSGHEASRFVNMISLSGRGWQSVRATPTSSCQATVPRIQKPLCSFCVDSRMLTPHLAWNCTCGAVKPLNSTTLWNDSAPLVLTSEKPSFSALRTLNFPFICARIKVFSLFPASCLSSGGYVNDGTPCVFPANPLGRASMQYSGCLPVTADMPFIKEKLTARTGNAGDDFWCPTVPKYSVLDDTKKNWGYCGLECGYASFEMDASQVPTTSPSFGSHWQTRFPSSSPTEYEYEHASPWRPRMYFARYVGYYGSYIEVNFDCDTDCGGSCNLPLPCSYFFVEADTSWICRWTSPKTLAVFQSAAVVRLTLTSANSIRCSYNTFPPIYAKGSVAVTGFQYIAPPVVALVAPTFVSRCASKDLVLDGTGSKVLSAGGIAWLKWELRWVEPALDMYAKDIQLLNARLDGCSKATQLYCATDAIPYDGRYAFALTIANGFGTTASSAVIIEVEGETAPILVQFSAGNLLQAKYPGDGASLLTSLEASVKVRDVCTNATLGNVATTVLNATAVDVVTVTGDESAGDQIGPLQLSWKIIGPRELILSRTVDLALIPTADPFVVSFSPAMLGLSPKYTLPYDVTVRLTAYLYDPRNPVDSSSLTYSDLVVRVVSTPLVLEIKNANRTLAESETTLMVVGQVVSGGRFSQEAIEYQWSCLMSSTINVSSPAVPCTGLSPSFVNLSAPQLSQVLLSNIRPASRYVFTLTAIGSAIDRTASVTAYFRSLPLKSTNDSVDPTDALKPTVQILRQDASAFVSVDASTRLNRDRTMRVLGACPKNGTLGWNLTDAGFRKDITYLLQTVPSAAIAPAGALLDGRYSLTLSCAGVTTSPDEGKIQFAINREPRGGSLSVTPQSGMVFSTLFALRAAGWIDDDGDLPLRYLFEFVTLDNNLQPISRSLAPLSAWATWETRLPFGTVAVRNRAVDALGAVSDFASANVNVTLPPTAQEFVDWFTAACRRWRTDLDYKPRSGVDVLSEIGASVRPLNYLYPLPLRNPDQSIMTKLLAFSMMRVALSNLGNMVLDDDLSEDAREEILNYVTTELLTYLPSRQAATELLEGLVKNQDEGNGLTTRGIQAAYEASFVSLQQLLSLTDQEKDVTVTCQLVQDIRSGVVPLQGVADIQLKWEATSLALVALSCRNDTQVPTSWTPSASPSTTVPTSSPLWSKTTFSPGGKSTVSPTRFKTPSSTIRTSVPSQLKTSSPSIRTWHRALQESGAANATSLIAWSDWSPVLRTLQRITDAALMGMVPGEDPVVLQASQSTYQAWRLGKASTRTILKVKSDQVVFVPETFKNDGGPVFHDMDDIWIATLRTAPDSAISSPTAFPSSSPFSTTSDGSNGLVSPQNQGGLTNDGSVAATSSSWFPGLTDNETSVASPAIYCFGGQAWSRWTVLRVQNIRFALGFNVTVLNETEDGDALVVEYTPFNVTTSTSLVRSRAALSCIRMTGSQTAFVNSCRITQHDIDPDLFDCTCLSSAAPQANGGRLRRRLTSDSFSSSTLLSNVLYMSAVGLPIDTGGGGIPLPSEPPFARPPTTEAPTKFNETRRPTLMPSRSPQISPLTIVPEQESQAWVSILTILCVCLICVLVGMVGLYLDRRDQKLQHKGRVVLEELERIRTRQLARGFFYKMQIAVKNNIFLVTDELAARNQRNRQEPTTPVSSLTVASQKREWWWKGFFKRHAWLSPLLAPFSTKSPRTSRVVLLFAIICGNMGMCSAFLIAGWTDVAQIGFVSSLVVFFMTVLLDLTVAIVARWWYQRTVKQQQNELQEGLLSSAQKSSTPLFPLPQESISTATTTTTRYSHRIKRKEEDEGGRQGDDRPDREPDDEEHQRPLDLDSCGSWGNDRAAADHSGIISRNERHAGEEFLLTLESGFQSRPHPSFLLTTESTPRVTNRGSGRASGVMQGADEPWTSWNSTPPVGPMSPGSSVPSAPVPNIVREKVKRIARTPLDLNGKLEKPQKDDENLMKVKKRARQFKGGEQPSRVGLVMRKLPMGLLGWCGAGFAVAFNASVSGLDRFYPWIQSWGVSLLFDAVLMQSVWALVRLSLAIASAHQRRLRRFTFLRRQLDLATSPSGASPPPSLLLVRMADAPPEMPYRWQARSALEETAGGGDLMLLDAVVEAASVDTDTEARELLEMILGVAGDETNNDDIDHFVQVGEEDKDGSNDHNDLPHPPASSVIRAGSPFTLLMTGSQQSPMKTPREVVQPQEEIEETEMEEGGDDDDDDSGVDFASGTLEGNVLSVVEPNERIREETIV